MFSGTAVNLSLEASDVQTDEDFEELAEEGFSFSVRTSDKVMRRKRSSGRRPPTAKSPYLSTLNMNPRRAAVAAWRLPRASLGDTRGESHGEMSAARLTSLSNGHDLTQMLKSDCDVTQELLKQTLTTRKHKHLHLSGNGHTSGGEYREKEDMYDEIIHLKKCLQAQKSDNHKMKAKVRRLEEDNAKREKQLEELLDPTKGPDYIRSFVDKRKEGSVVLNGLKQRILKLEQQCREKENALSKLQSELRTTNLEELKITVETYYEEVQRLKMLLQASEKSCRAESKCSQRQQKALSSTVLRLSENLKELQQENSALKEELKTESPAVGVKGYREWSKQRLLRRLFEVEKRLEESRRAPRTKSRSLLDREVQTTPTGTLDVTGGVTITIATAAAISVGTNTEEAEEVCDEAEPVSQLETERAELQELLLSKEDELSQLWTEREELLKETESWKTVQRNERVKEKREYEQQLALLRGRIQSLEYRNTIARAEPPSVVSTSREEREDEGAGAQPEDGEDGEDTDGAGTEKEKTTRDPRQTGRDEAAKIIQSHWREHRQRDVALLQSALRGHLLRVSQLKELQKEILKYQVTEATCHSNMGSCGEGQLDMVALTMIQSVFRGHLSRCGHTKEGSGLSVPSPSGDIVPAVILRRARPTQVPDSASAALGERRAEQDDPSAVSGAQPSRMTPAAAQRELRRTAQPGGAAAVDSDDSDDIIVSPSRPLRSREVLIS